MGKRGIFILGSFPLRLMHSRVAASLVAESWCFMGTVDEVLDAEWEDGLMVV